MYIAYGSSFVGHSVYIIHDYLHEGIDRKEDNRSKEYFQFDVTFLLMNVAG
jgi:hypothetical protein